MRCPICDGKTIVIETRESPTFGLKRRRRCENKHYFTTQEVVIPREALIQERGAHIRRITEQSLAVRKGGRKAAGKAAPGKDQTY